MSYERRSFSETAVDTTLVGTIDDSTDSFTIADYSGWPSGSGGKFFARIESETLLVTTNTAGTMTGVERAQNGTSAATHTAGVGVSHVACKRDYDEANYAVSETVGKVTAVGDLLYADGVNSLDRLAKGTAGTYLKQGASIPAWTALVSTDVSDLPETVADTVGAMLTGNTETGISVDYQDADNTIDFVVDTEFICDTAGAMFTGNTETGITATYQDADNTVDLVVGVDDSSIEISGGLIQVKANGILASHIGAVIGTAEIASGFTLVPTTLSDWTPVIRQTGSMTVSVQYGKYQQVGKLVTAWAHVTITGGSASAGAQIDFTLPVSHNFAQTLPGGGCAYISAGGAHYLGMTRTFQSDATRAACDFSTLAPSITLTTNDVLEILCSYAVA
jgi:hypothetical protein